MDLFANERQAKIPEIIKNSGAVTTAALMEMFNVSVETVRRDLLNMGFPIGKRTFMRCSSAS